MEIYKIGYIPERPTEETTASNILWFGKIAETVENPYLFFIVPSIRAFTLVSVTDDPEAPWAFEVTIDGAGVFTFKFKEPEAAVKRWKALHDAVESYWFGRRN